MGNNLVRFEGLKAVGKRGESNQTGMLWQYKLLQFHTETFFISV
jgi:hypothetical protein